MQNKSVSEVNTEYHEFTTMFMDLIMQEGEISPDSWERIINMLNFSFKLPNLQRKPKI